VAEAVAEEEAEAEEEVNVTLRRLDPDTDEQLVRDAVAWLDDQPRFYQDCDAAWGKVEDAEDYLRVMRADAQADFGVFEDELIAVITVTLEGKGSFNSHLMVKRGASVQAICVGAASVIKQLFENGMVEGWSWLARKNYGARKILSDIGMKLDGLEQIKGASHGKPISWVRYSVRAT
jgi:hypothetical protein